MAKFHAFASTIVLIHGLWGGRSSPASAGFATGRFTTPAQVAMLITMLASERTANVTGANHVVDAG